MAVHAKLVFTRSATGAEDVAITTHDFEGPDVTPLNVAGWVTRLTTWWTVIDEYYPSGLRLSEIRFYNGYNGDGTPGAVDLVTPLNLPGTGLGSELPLPPQCACSVTEELYEGHLRRNWGRFYLPAPTIRALGTDGRYAQAFITAVLDATKALYDGLGADGWTAIIWVTTPTLGQAIVDGLRVDDIVDTIRRRRWDRFIIRNTRDLVAGGP